MPAPELTDTEPLRDSALLREYAAAGSRAAFTEMVQRHRGLVFSTALRITGEHTMAEEAAQNAFAILARKAAAVARCDQPGAWLYRTTVFEAKKRLRSETRHRRRLAALEAESSTMNAPATTDTPLHDLLPHVDECIQRLRPAEQDAIRMRYMEDRSYADIAAVLGKSEEAGKKHTARALERLCSLLRRRGVVSAAALTASLQAGSRTASAISLECLTTTALRSAATLTRGQLLLHSLQLMTTKQSAAAAAVLLLLCSAPVLWQERAIAHTRAELAAANVPPPAPPAGLPVITPEQNAKVVAVLQRLREPDPGQIDLQAAVAVAAKRDMGFGEEMPRYQLMEKLSLAELQALFAKAASLPDGDRERTQLLLISLLAKQDPQTALRAALPLCRTVGEDFYPYPPHSILYEIAGIYDLWMKQDWRAALSSYESLRAKGAFDGSGIRQTGGELAESIVAQCYEYSPEEARRLFATLPPGYGVNALQNIAGKARMDDRAFLLTEADRLTAESRDQNYRQWIVSAMVRGEAERSGPEAGMKLLSELKVAGEDRQHALTAILHTQLKAPLHEGCLAVLKWAKENLPPQEATLAAAKFLGATGDQKTRNAAFRAFDWGEQRNAAIAAMLGTGHHTNDPVEAVSLAQEITDHALKVATLQQLALELPPSRRGFGFMLRIQSDSSLSPEERASILNPPKQP